MEEKRLNIPFQTKSDTNMERADRKLVVKMNIPTESSENDEENTNSRHCIDQEQDAEIYREALLEQVHTAQEELERRKQHSKRVEELNRALEEWKADFARALGKTQNTFTFI